MRLLTAAITLLLAAYAAQTTAPTVELPDGASIAVRLITNLKANKAHAGDEVLAEVIVPVLNRGQIAVPGGARVIGHVVSSKARSKQDPESVLGIRFERLEWKDGAATLQAYIVGMLAGLPGSSRPNDCFPSRMFPQRPPISQFQSQAPNVLNGVPQPTHDTGSRMGTDPSGITGRPCAVAGPPDFSYIKVRKLDQPRGATQLVSSKKNISLPTGISVELRQIAP